MLKKILIVGGIVAVIVFAIALNPFILKEEIKIDISGEIAEAIEAKRDMLKDDVIARLRKCESAGHSEADGIIIFDSNNRASIGVLQFQKATVIHYYKTLYGKDITGKEAVMIAIDAEESLKLAKDILFTTEKGYTNWLNCSNKYGFKAEIAIINKI